MRVPGLVPERVSTPASEAQVSIADSVLKANIEY